MNRPPEYSTALFILGSAALAAVAILLVPTLFDEFRVVRLAAVVALAASAFVLGLAALRSRKDPPH